MDETIIRTAIAGDASRFVTLWNTLQAESEGLLFEVGHSQQAQTQPKQTSKPDPGFAHILFLEDTIKLQLAGFAAATTAGPASDSAELIIGIRQSHCGQGWGRKLLTSMQSWAQSSGYRQLTLAVAANNRIALKLYRRFGFTISRTNPDSVRTQSGVVDLYIMTKPLRQRAKSATACS
jgi:ribosomal protein S18 acetylase RimI-like enzyme